MQCRIPPRVYSYYQESFKGINTAGNDKKEALIQAQIHQDQQQVLTAQQIAQIKLQAAQDYSNFWDKYDHFDWEHSSKEEILRHINETPQMMLNWMQQIDKNAEKLPPELQQAYKLQSLQEGIEQKKREAEQFQRLGEEARKRGDLETADKYFAAARNAENLYQACKETMANQVKHPSQNVTQSFTRGENGQSPQKNLQQRTEKVVKGINKETGSERKQEPTQSHTETPKDEMTQLRENIEQEAQQTAQKLNEMKQNGTGTSYEQMQVMAKFHEAQKHLQEIKDMENAEQNMQSAVQQLHEMEQNGTGTSYEQMQVMAKFHEAQKSYDERLKYENAEQNVQRLTQQLHEMEQNGTGTSYEKMQLMADLHEAQKYSRELNGEKTNQGKTQPTSNKQLASTKESENPAAPKVPNENTGNAEKADTSAKTAETENPAAPKVPDENKIASDNTALSQHADTHSNIEESGKSAESVSGLTTLKLSATKLNETIDESNYQFRTTGLELA